MDTSRHVLLVIASVVLNEAAAQDSVVVKPPVNKCIVSPDAPDCSPAVTKLPVDKCAVSPDALGCSPAETELPVDKCAVSPDADGCSRAVTKSHVASCTLSADRSCEAGYVWRLAGADDFVCVHPDWARRVQLDNEDAKNNVDPSGAEGPDTCKPGLVWRKAFRGDVVCVTREVRLMTRDQNRNPDRHRACN
jgi:hypothetical protein